MHGKGGGGEISSVRSVKFYGDACSRKKIGKFD